jgi:hypothetical protein
MSFYCALYYVLLDEVLILRLVINLFMKQIVAWTVGVPESHFVYPALRRRRYVIGIFVPGFAASNGFVVLAIILVATARRF